MNNLALRRTLGKKSISGKYQTAVVYNGYIYRSTDYGVTWSQVGNSNNWYSVAMSSDGKYQTAVVHGGYIYRSTDYGVTWSQVGNSNNCYSVAINK